MTKREDSNRKIFSHYSDQELIKLFNDTDSGRFPGSYKLLISEMKNRDIDACALTLSKSKEQASKNTSILSSVMKYFEEKHNIPRILFKIAVSALISTFTVAVEKLSYIEGVRGKLQPNSSEMTYREACTYLRETLDKSINIWLITFLLTLAYFVWRDKKS